MVLSLLVLEARCLDTDHVAMS